MSAFRTSGLIGCVGALALAACTTTNGGRGEHSARGGGRPVQVTRFHLDQPIAPGEVAVEPLDPAQQGSLEFKDYAGIVDGELQRLGFRPASTVGQSELVATVDVHRGARTAPPRGGVSFGVGVGGGSVGRSGGVAGGGEVGATVPVGGPREIVTTELAVQIKRRSDGTLIWEGRARLEAPDSAPEGAPLPAVTRDAHALFTGFPGPSGQTILVR